MRRISDGHCVALTLVLVAGVASSAWAVPYASGIYTVTGNTKEFVLNESADSITVLRNGANPVTFNNPTPGRYQFDMTGFSTYSIQVAKNAPVGFAELSQSNNSNLFTKYFRPNSVAVNKDPASPYFGTVYVNNSVPTATASPVRQQGDGIYSLTADLVGVDLVTKAPIANADDASLAKRDASWVDGGTNGTYQMSLDSAGNLIVGDWSDVAGGIKYMKPDLTSGGLILDIQDGVRPLLTNSSGKEIHGSIASKPYTTGSVGNGLTVYAMDEDFDLDGDTVTADTGNHVWKWNVGNATSYDQPPELVINVSPLSGPVNDPGAQPTDAVRSNYLNLNVGVDAKAIYSPQYDKWYLTQNRNDGNQAGLIVVSADGVDGNTPTLEWSSIQWSIDNNLDGFTDDADPVGTAADNGKQDVFRGMGTPTLSNDGTKLYVHRRQVLGSSPYTGQGSPLSGAVLEIPLDANGIPVIDINDNGTPGNTADDLLSNLRSITIANNNNNKGSHDITMDAAGNIYIGSNSSERIQVFSPGGNTLATTNSDGTFSVTSQSAGLAGDFNGDHKVDAADYTTWRDHLGAGDESSLNGNGDGANGVDAGDYTLWKTNFGMSNGSGAGAVASVPEPTSLAIVVLGLIGGVGHRRRRRD
ncbi:MAG: PEP-CTERM sorting domain-containing protein [Pirellulales bacterium]